MRRRYISHTLFSTSLGWRMKVPGYNAQDTSCGPHMLEKLGPPDQEQASFQESSHSGKATNRDRGDMLTMGICTNTPRGCLACFGLPHSSSRLQFSGECLPIFLISQSPAWPSPCFWLVHTRVTSSLSCLTLSSAHARYVRTYVMSCLSTSAEERTLDTEGPRTLAPYGLGTGRSLGGVDLTMPVCRRLCSFPSQSPPSPSFGLGESRRRTVCLPVGSRNSTCRPLPRQRTPQSQDVHHDKERGKTQTMQAR